MMKKLLVVSLCCCLILACASPRTEGPSVEHGFSTALVGLGHLLLSPLQIAAGLLEGIASVPYYLSTHLQQINQGLIEAQAEITLDDTYESAYGKRLSEVPESGDTGVVFRGMKQATQFFQKILTQYGVQQSNRYILTSLEEKSGKYALLAVIYRPSDAIQVINKPDSKTIHSFTPVDSQFYEPYQQDIHGNFLDTIIDWAALSKDFLKTQKAQAILLTLAANSVLNGKKTPAYWQIEQRWLSGNVIEIVEENTENLNKRMGI